MKNFTKFALIMALVLVILGSVFCTVSLAMGFNYDDFWEDVEDGRFAFGPVKSVGDLIWRGGVNWNDDGEGWRSASTERYTFACQGDDEGSIDKLNLDVYYGYVYIVENTDDADKIQVTVEYRKKNHRRKVEAYRDGSSLKIKETGSKRSRNNDSTRITIAIPGDVAEGTGRMLEEILLQQNAGEIYVNMPLTAQKIDLAVSAGECEADFKMNALKELNVDVGAGEMNLCEVESPKLSMDVGVGELDIERMNAEDIYIDCGIGSIDATAAGREDDYDYDISCNVGEVSIGERSYSGLGASKEINNGKDKKMQIDCGIGEVDISFGL